MPGRSQVSTLGEMYARATARQQRETYRHDMNYEWYCTDHDVKWTGFVTSRCWIEGCRTMPIKWSEQVRRVWAGRYKADRERLDATAV